MKTFDRVVFAVIGIALSVIAVRPLVVPTPSVAAPPKEYKVLVLPTNLEPTSQVESMLNASAKAGWEIAYGVMHVVILKK